MNELAVASGAFPAMSDEAIAKVNALRDMALSVEQADFETSHVLHAGMYARTMNLAAGNMVIGSLLKVQTIVVFHGDAHVFVGDSTIRLTGYHVIPAEAFRKQIFVAITDSMITAIHATKATTISEAEDEATSESENLLSRRTGAKNILQNKGESPCLTQQ